MTEHHSAREAMNAFERHHATCRACGLFGPYCQDGKALLVAWEQAKGPAVVPNQLPRRKKR